RKEEKKMQAEGTRAKGRGLTGAGWSGSRMGNGMGGSRLHCARQGKKNREGVSCGPKKKKKRKEKKEKKKKRKKKEKSGPVGHGKLKKINLNFIYLFIYLLFN